MAVTVTTVRLPRNTFALLASAKLDEGISEVVCAARQVPSGKAGFAWEIDCALPLALRLSGWFATLSEQAANVVTLTPDARRAIAIASAGEAAFEKALDDFVDESDWRYGTEEFKCG